MGLQNFGIILDNHSKTYYSGQTISGKVQLTVSSPKKINAISIKFKGEANTSWTESVDTTDADGNSKSVNDYFRGEEKYLNHSFNLLVGRNGKPIVLEKGDHSFPFTYTLPQNLPSSFEGLHGNIRYTIKVTLDRPWKFNQDLRIALSVASLVDLNIYPQLKAPLNQVFEKRFSSLFSQSKPLLVTVSLPHSGFVPGETVPLDIKCRNTSNVDLSDLKFKLQRVVIYHARFPRNNAKIDRGTIAKYSLGAAKGGTYKKFYHNIIIPPVPPTTTIPYALIDIKYEVLIIGVMSGLHKNIEFSSPITIGTVPFVTSVSQPPPASPPPLSITPSAPVDDTTPSSPPPYHALYPTLPPPTYEESIFKTSSINDESDSEHTRGDSSYFAPRYPCFRCEPSAPPLG